MDLGLSKPKYRKEEGQQVTYIVVEHEGRVLNIPPENLESVNIILAKNPSMTKMVLDSLGVLAIGAIRPTSFEFVGGYSDKEDIGVVVQLNEYEAKRFVMASKFARNIRIIDLNILRRIIPELAKDPEIWKGYFRKVEDLLVRYSKFLECINPILIKMISGLGQEFSRLQISKSDEPYIQIKFNRTIKPLTIPKVLKFIKLEKQKWLIDKLFCTDNEISTINIIPHVLEVLKDVLLRNNPRCNKQIINRYIDTLESEFMKRYCMQAFGSKISASNLKVQQSLVERPAPSTSCPSYYSDGAGVFSSEERLQYRKGRMKN